MDPIKEDQFIEEEQPEEELRKLLKTKELTNSNTKNINDLEMPKRVAKMLDMST